MKAKQTKPQERWERKKTGGGSPDIEQDTLFDKVSSILPNQEIKSIPNAFDDDVSLYGDQHDTDNESNYLYCTLIPIVLNIIYLTKLKK